MGGGKKTALVGETWKIGLASDKLQRGPGGITLTENTVQNSGYVERESAAKS